MKGEGRIINGVLHLEKKLLEHVAQFQEGMADIEITVINKPAHYLYKYLHGYLLASMAQFIGDRKEDIYFTLKEQHAMEKVETWLDIPVRHRRKCQRLELDNGVAVSRMYIKSASSMTHDELKEFVQAVENDFFGFCQGRIEEKMSREAKQYRKKGFMSAAELKKYEQSGGSDG